MNAMSIRRIDPDVHAWLREQAALHGVSVEEEVRSLLRAARDAAVAARRRDEQARWDAVFAQAITLPPGAPDSTDIIREMRDER
jgi:plasmid stability protein